MIDNDPASDNRTLSEISEKPTLKIKRIKQQVIETFKTANNINPVYKKIICTTKQTPRVWRCDLIVRNHNTPTNWGKSLRILGLKIWNALFKNI